MTANVKPSGLLGQTLVLLVLGAMFGLGARVAQDADFRPVVEELTTTTDIGLAPTDDPSGNGDSPNPPARPPMLEPEKVEFMTVMGQMFGQPRVTVIDARDVGTYENGHIKGAIHLDGEELSEDPNSGRAVLDPIPKDQVLLVYCSGGDCDLSLRVGRILIARGFSYVYVYEGGYTEWQQEGGPIVRGPDPY